MSGCSMTASMGAAASSGSHAMARQSTDTESSRPSFDQSSPMMSSRCPPSSATGSFSKTQPASGSARAHTCTTHWWPPVARRRPSRLQRPAHTAPSPPSARRLPPSSSSHVAVKTIIIRTVAITAAAGQGHQSDPLAYFKYNLQTMPKHLNSPAPGPSPAHAPLWPRLDLGGTSPRCSSTVVKSEHNIIPLFTPIAYKSYPIFNIHSHYC